MAQRDGVYLTGCNQSAQHFTHLAAGSKRREEELYIFHGGGDDGLQIDGSENRDGGDLRGGCALGNGLLEALAEQLPLRCFAGSADDRDNAQLLPELGDGAQHCCLSNFAAKGVLERGNVGVADFKQLVSLHSQLRDLTRASELRSATPVAITAQRIDVRQNPGRHYKVRLFAGQAQQVEPNGDAVQFQPYKEFLSKGDLFGLGRGIALSGNRLNK
jgi:hypothetical protein